jgi:hypothetical protein
MHEKGELDIDYVKSAGNISDVCTKIMGPQPMSHFWQLLGLHKTE